MRRLHLKLYLAIVGTMVVFLIAGAMVWHHFALARMAAGGIESATQLAAEMLDEATAILDSEHEVLDALSRQLHAEVVLYDARKRHRRSDFGGRSPELTPSSWDSAG